jgi:hypothetical protein
MCQSLIKMLGAEKSFQILQEAQLCSHYFMFLLMFCNFLGGTMFKSIPLFSSLLIIFLVFPIHCVHAEDNWENELRVTLGDLAEAEDYFGTSIAVSGNYAVVGAPHKGEAGAAYVFWYNGNSWLLHDTLVPTGLAPGDRFGWSVDIYGDYIIVGDPFGSLPVEGIAYLFKRNNDQWEELGPIFTADGYEKGFGSSVAISDGYFAVGAPWKEQGHGEVHVFAYNDNLWSRVATVQSSDVDFGDYFGQSVDLSSTTLVVGAPQNDIHGSAYTFQQNGVGTWLQTNKLSPTPNIGSNNAYFGRVVAISGNTIAIGAPQKEDGFGTMNDTGAAYVFQYSENTWIQKEMLIATDHQPEDYFGSSIAVTDGFILVGAYGEDDNGEYAGAAYVFQETSTGWVELPKLSAINGSSGDSFGAAVAISNNHAIIGASGNDYEANDAGAIHIFEHNSVACSYTVTPTDKAMPYEADTFDITITTTNTCEWTVTESLDWLDVSPNSGVGNGSITVSLDENNSFLARNGQIIVAGTHVNVAQGRVSWSQNKIIPGRGNADELFGYSVAIDGNRTIAGSYWANTNGRAFIFNQQGSDWLEQSELIPEDSESGNDKGFGYSVSISGDYAIVGAPYDHEVDTKAGAAYIFKWDGVSWNQQIKLFATYSQFQNIYDQFGYSVAISGDYAVVSTPLEGIGGGAYVFKREGTLWTQEARLTGDDTTYTDDFGKSVAISGDYIVIGAQRDDDTFADSGSAYIFKRESTGWTQQAKLVASDSAASDRFGSAVDINDGYVIVGASEKNDAAGAAYIFKRTEEAWNHVSKLESNAPSTNAYFGCSVSLSEKYAVIGEQYTDSYSGSVHVFERSGDLWVRQSILTATDGENSDALGSSVSVSGGHIVAGATGDDDNGSNSGSVYTFFSGDSDGDGVVDDMDECPDTAKGVLVDAKGCVLKKGDFNKDGNINLNDSQLGLKVINLQEATVDPSADVDGDGKIGLKDTIYTIQQTQKKSGD